MKSRFVYINSAEVTQDLKVYSVYLGTSKRDRSLVDRLTLLSRHSTNVYFAKYSQEVCDFLSKLAVQLHGCTTNPLNAFYELNHRWVTSKEFRKIFISPSYQSNVQTQSKKHYGPRK